MFWVLDYSQSKLQIRIICAVLLSFFNLDSDVSGSTNMVNKAAKNKVFRTSAATSVEIIKLFYPLCCSRIKLLTTLIQSALRLKNLHLFTYFVLFKILI